jgi:hypothetical protein
MGRLEAHRLGLGSWCQLGLRLSRPARADGLDGREARLGLTPPRAGGLLFLLLLLLGWPFVFSPSRPGVFWPPPPLTGRSHLSASAGSSASRLGSGVADERACVRECAGESARRVLGSMPQGMAATRTRRRGRVAGVSMHGEAGSRQGGSTARARAGGAHARARCLAAQDRGVAVPCAGHRHSGPAARRRRRRATAFAGVSSGATGSCKKSGTAAGGERGSLRLLQRAHRLGRQQRGREKGRRPWCSPAG